MRRPLCTYCLFFAAVMFVIVLCVPPPAFSLGGWAGEETVLQGSVTQKEESEKGQVLYLTDVTFCDGDFQHLQIENMGVICYMESNEESGGDLPALGSYVQISGTVQEFSMATNPGEFDMKEYYQISGYHFRVVGGKTDALLSEGSPWKEGLYRLRKYLEKQADAVFGEASSVLSAMLLGDKKGMDAEIKELYQVAGIAHVLAISGLHVSILGVGLYKLLQRLAMPVWACSFIPLGLLVCYAQMTGVSVSTVRAVTMFGFFLCAKYFRRTYDLLTAMSVAAVAISLWNPYHLRSSAFWLSFMAVVGISVFAPALTEGLEQKLNRLAGLSKKTRMRVLAGLKSLITTFAVSIFTMPIVLLFFYELPLYGFLLNLFVVPLMTFLFIAALVALLLGCIWLPAGQWIAGICSGILWFYEILCRSSLLLPFQNGAWGKPAPMAIAGFYLLTAWIIYEKKIKHSYWSKWVILLCAICILGIKAPAPLTMTFLDVGQGDGICIETAEGYVCMIDGGSSDKDLLWEYQLEPFLKSRGISRVDYWFVTHPDADHCSGLLQMWEPAVAEVPGKGISVGCLVLPDAASIREDAADLIRLAEANGTEVVYLSSGEALYLDEIYLYCHHPETGNSAEDKNAYSLVLSLHYGAFDVLFTGDVTAEGEGEILRRGSLASEVMDGGGMVSEVMDGGGMVSEVMGGDGMAFGVMDGGGMVSEVMGGDGMAFGDMDGGGMTLDGTWEILKVAHHGSRFSSTESFLQEISPMLAVVSCGAGNSYGHPHDETLQRLHAAGSTILTTPEYGAIVVEVRREGREMTVYGYLESLE